MKKASLVVSPYYGKNRIFDIHDKVSNRDNCLYLFHALKQAFQERNIDLATQDINSVAGADIVIYNDMPQIMPSITDVHKSYLMLFESELIRADNWNMENHQYFNTIFTWHDDYIGRAKYVKINFAHFFPQHSNNGRSVKKKLCAMIAMNKRSSHPLELYSERVNAVRWFEKHHPSDFDLYGIGWDTFRFQGSGLARMLNKMSWLTQLVAPRYPAYRGSVESKRETLQQYRFAICYENAKDIPGYITEKIFDCFFSSCVPIYHGANNVADYIPRECFIDKRAFTSYETLYNYLVKMTEADYNRYLSAIENFLTSDRSRQFSADHVAQTIVNTVTHG